MTRKELIKELIKCAKRAEPARTCDRCGASVAQTGPKICAACNEHVESKYSAPVDPYVEHREKNRDIEAMTFKCAVADGITGVQHTCASCATPIPDEAFEPALGYVVRVMNCRVCGGAV